MSRNLAFAALVLFLGTFAPIVGTQDPEGAMGTYPLPPVVAMAGTPLHEGVYLVSQEDGYNGGTDGIQFFHLQREGKPDRATVSIDADLPLAGALRQLRGKRVNLRLSEDVSRELQELKR